MRLTAFKVTCLLLVSVFAHGQLRHTSHYFRKTGWLCGESIILDSAGLFFKESGCEGDQVVSFGKYRISKSGRLSVKFLPLDSIAPIRQVKQTDKVDDSLVTVRLFDREDEPVSSSFRVVLIDTAGKKEDVWLLDNGTLVINRFLYRQLFLAQLGLLYVDIEPIIIGGHSIDIYFNLPRMFMMYSETKRGQEYPLRLIVKNDGLYNLRTKRKEYELTE
jgi:hypothetical protein